jgi:hypothetical protein
VGVREGVDWGKPGPAEKKAEPTTVPSLVQRAASATNHRALRSLTDRECSPWPFTCDCASSALHSPCLPLLLRAAVCTSLLVADLPARLPPAVLLLEPTDALAPAKISRQLRSAL